MGAKLSVNLPSAKVIRQLDAEEISNAVFAAGLVCTVFLAGPYIQISGKRPGPGKANVAKRLRFDLHKRLSDAGYLVTMGEFDRLISAAKPLLMTNTTASAAELLHVIEHADVVVMLPSSPGSFLELGAFAMSEVACRKMIIVVDKKHEKDPPNYLNSGPLMSAKKKGCKLYYHDYVDSDGCWALIHEFVVDRLGIIAERRLISA